MERRTDDRRRRRRHGRLFLMASRAGAFRIDIVPKHVALAEQKAQATPKTHRFKASVGDARALLEIADGSVDLVISHGPLYHLTDRNDRLATLSEARRILKPGGIMLAFTITRYAGINYAIPNGLVFDETYYSVMREEVLTGLCNNNPRRISTFTNAFFHLPEEIRDEVREAGLEYEKTLGVIGTAWLVPELDHGWRDEAKRERILAVARLLENEPVLGPRMMTVARKEPMS
jgi:SAM-dependent methyltransferase